MQRKDPQRLSELLPQILSDLHIDRRLDETQAAVLWREIFGPAVTGEVGGDVCHALLGRVAERTVELQSLAVATAQRGDGAESDK